MKRFAQTALSTTNCPANASSLANTLKHQLSSTLASQPFDEMPPRNYRLLHLIKLKADVMTVHCLAVKVDAITHLPTSTSLIMAYSRTGYFTSSLALFNEVRLRDVVIWNAMMTASLENHCYRVALNFFAQMIEEGGGFDSTTLVIVISALSRELNKLLQGKSLHGLSIKMGLLSDSSLCNSLICLYAKAGDLSSSECTFAEMVSRDLVSWNSLISCCLKNNKPDKSLWYFKQLRCSGRQGDNVSLSCATAACSHPREFTIGQVIHGLGFKLGYRSESSSNISIANSLISFYSRYGEIHDAETVFRGILYKDVVSWNAMIYGFVSNGYVFEALGLLREMQMQSQGSVVIDAASLVPIIPLCAEHALLREGKSVHGFMIRRGRIGTDMLVINCLLNMYFKFGDIKSAQVLFKSTPTRDLVTWNTTISGHSRTGQPYQAQTLFKQFLYSFSEFSLSTVTGILPSCNSPEFLEFGKSIHCWQIKMGFSDNILTDNSLMLMYINCGDLVASLSRLQRICVIADDTTCWNTVIAGCTQNGYFREALSTFNLMRQESFAAPDCITLVNVITACGNLERLFEGKLIHGLAHKTWAGTDTRVQNALVTMYARVGKIQCSRSVFDLCCCRNLCSWNCMISALSQNNDAKSALELSKILDLEPNEITIATVLSACTQLGTIGHGREIHGFVFRREFQTNSFITAALVDMYSNCGSLDVGVKIFEYSQDKSVAAWNSLISGYGFHSNGRKAIQVFEEMTESGRRPTKTTFINLLSACGHCGLVKEGLEYYGSMTSKYGVEVEAEHKVCVVDMLGRAGRMSEAYEFIKKTSEEAAAAPGVWGALLSACNYHGDVEMGRRVADILFEMDPNNVVGYYVCLSNAYVGAGRWDEAVELRDLIQEKQLKKPPGYSLLS